MKRKELVCLAKVKSVFFLCEKCGARIYKFKDVIETARAVTFKTKCSCGYEGQTLFVTGSKQAEMQKEAMKTMLNPKNMAKYAMVVRKEMEGQNG